MKFFFYQFFLFLFILINLFQCQNNGNIINSNQNIYQQLYNATQRVVSSLAPPVCFQILLNISDIQSQYISPNGLSGRVLPIGTFTTRILALEYLYAILCPIPNFPAPDNTIQTAEVKYITYHPEYFITQFELILNLTGNKRLSLLARTAFDQDYKFCAYDAQLRNPGLTLDTYTNEEHQASIYALCNVAQIYCNGTLQQYESVNQCLQYLTTNVTYGSYDRGDQGNVACRLLHIKMVPISPSIHCLHIGPTGGGACTNKTIDFYYDQPDFLACAYKYSQNLFPGGD